MAIILIPLLILLLWAGALHASKGRRWFLWLWVPFLLLSLLGTGLGIYCLIALVGLSRQGGEAAGFAGAAFFLGAISSIPFLIGLVVALIMRPVPKNIAK